MSTLVIVQLLFSALALVMFGLGLSLQVEDFRRLWRVRRAVAIALGLQMLALPLVAWGLVRLIGLDAPYAVGLVLLAVAPASVTANLYSKVFGGNVALTVSLTGLNTLLSMLTLPLVCGWAMAHFMSGEPAALTAVVAKLAEAMILLTVPVVLGMAVRARAPAIAARADKPMRLISLLVLVAFSLAAIVKEWSALKHGFAEVGLAVLAFNVLSLLSGYGVPRALGLQRSDCVAVAFELGIRSAVLTIYVAMTVLADLRIALPAAVYSVSMVVLGMGFGLWTRGAPPAAAPLPAPVSLRD